LILRLFLNRVFKECFVRWPGHLLFDGLFYDLYLLDTRLPWLAWLFRSGPQRSPRLALGHWGMQLLCRYAFNWSFLGFFGIVRSIFLVVFGIVIIIYNVVRNIYGVVRNFYGVLD